MTLDKIANESIVDAIDNARCMSFANLMKYFGIIEKVIEKETHHALEQAGYVWNHEEHKFQDIHHIDLSDMKYSYMKGIVRNWLNEFSFSMSVPLRENSIVSTYRRLY